MASRASASWGEHLSEGFRAFTSLVKQRPYYNPAAGPIPKEMWSVQSVEKGKVALKKVPVPVPEAGEVLVRLQYTPVHPHDINYAMGFVNYGADEIEVPHSIGNEGSGVVVGSGGGLLAHYYCRSMTRVAATSDKAQFWSEYAVASATQTLPLPDSLDSKKGAAAFVNPTASLVILTLAYEGGHKALVISPANSQVGLQTTRGAAYFGLKTVCIVRGEDRVRMLEKDVGVPREQIVRSDVDSFESDLRKAVELTGATIAFDGIAGDVSSTIYKAMPKKADVYYYGNIGGGGVPKELEDKENDPEKFFRLLHAPKWVAESYLRKVKLYYRLSKLLEDKLYTDYAREISLEDKELIDTIHSLGKEYKTGKVLIKMPAADSE
ncbi:Enoyl-acyl-carrier-protein reductase, mitochondrial [Hondaea fermentalgiana]|uniref:Enoyl-acyl-carrier-protein reductase, mitochondrial n=1 Tax=Hondaea fermentalgiana TaxID=2315210 RepID=A0A2R5G767_9STRA|nr:Enoyl-acyl-carrier-protein reductase, mitochondrial [Hondaea fermentalgiana]|eukprot:GBG26169.1 Enoyl-acyl-carrier-protein reductase, mitochondrial [Hondaea fermentalgiana]